MLSALLGVTVCGLLAGCAVFRQHASGNAQVPEPLKPVDLQRYLGRWYEIARYEQSFQKDCDEVSATYSLRPDGRIGIVNACRKPSGELTQATAKAFVVKNSGNAKLKVSFFLSLYIGNYWVMDHDADYQWAIVGDPSGRYLWLLDRHQNPPAAEKTALADRAASLGYDISMLRWTAQP